MIRQLIAATPRAVNQVKGLVMPERDNIVLEMIIFADMSVFTRCFLRYPTVAIEYITKSVAAHTARKKSFFICSYIQYSKPNS